jgi:hypothetical protein
VEEGDKDEVDLAQQGRHVWWRLSWVRWKFGTSFKTRLNELVAFGTIIGICSLADLEPRQTKNVSQKNWFYLIRKVKKYFKFLK